MIAQRAAAHGLELVVGLLSNSKMSRGPLISVLQRRESPDRGRMKTFPACRTPHADTAELKSSHESGEAAIECRAETAAHQSEKQHQTHHMTSPTPGSRHRGSVWMDPSSVPEENVVFTHVQTKGGDWWTSLCSATSSQVWRQPDFQHFWCQSITDDWHGQNCFVKKKHFSNTKQLVLFCHRQLSDYRARVNLHNLHDWSYSRLD